MGKTSKCKDKAKAKTDKAKDKVARKCKGKCVALFAAFALAFLAGCASSESAQPAKSPTLTADLDGCTIIIAGKVSMPIAGTNQTITAEGEKLPTIELLTQTQSLESSGTESYAQTATQPTTTDVKPDVDLHYNDAVGKGGDAASAFLSALTTECFAAVKAATANKQNGTITVQTKDGKIETLDCENGTCTTSSGVKITSENCESCTVK